MNPNFTPSNYTSFAIETKLQRDWQDNVTKEYPLLACIKDSDLHWNKGFEVKGLKAIVPLMTSLVTGMTPLTAGVADAAQIPAGWPTWDGTQGFTQAEYQFTHLERPMVITSSDDVIGGGKGGARGNLIDGKTNQLMETFRSVMADMMAGASADSRTSLMGLAYLLSQSNVVGNIDQTTYAYWRAGLTPNVGTLSLPVIDNAYDLINQNGNSEEMGAPDLMLLSYAGGSSVNTYGRVRSQIAPAERIVNAKFKAQYGFANFEYLDMKCVQDNRGQAGTANILTTKTFFYGGNDKPKSGQEQRIPGSSAVERIYTLWCVLGNKEPRRNHRLTGING